MSKQEFLEKLRAALSGHVSASIVEDNISYYEEYINTQIRMGTAEYMVMQNLGDPRLIAKSIITANTGDGFEKVESRARYERDNNEDRYYAEERAQGYPKVVRVHGWLALLLVIVILVVVVGAVFSLISLLFPVIVVVGLVSFFVKLFKDWLN